jgi:pSer/pThr/pTyr-binding forkhead associated (FHA) protein
MAVILTLDRNGERTARELKNGAYRLGREAPADLVVPDPTISALHAELQVTGESCTVRDLGSTNGTYINDVPVRTATPVRPSDRLRFGQVNATMAPAQQALPKPDASPRAVTVKLQAAQQAARQLSWSARFWIASAEALLCLVLLVIIIISYSESGSAAERRLFHFREFAAQYVQLLTPAMTTVPAPLLDESLQEPIMVLDREGKPLYPPAIAGQEHPSHLVNQKTNQIYEAARQDVFHIPDSSFGGGNAYSYPIRKNGELLGFVIAQPRDSAGSSILTLTLSVLIAGVLACIVLYFALRPVQHIVRSEIEGMATRVTAVAGGLMESLPRSVTVPELNVLAIEVERAVTRKKADRNVSGGAAGGRQDWESLARLADLVDTASIAYCLVDSDYIVQHLNAGLSRFREFGNAAAGVSLFGPGLSTVQARDLVQAMNAGAATPFFIDLERNKEQHRYAVYTRTFQIDGRKMYGLLFTIGGTP